MHKFVEFDICACTVIVMLIFSMVSRRIIKGRESKVFLAFLVVSLIAAVSSLITGMAINNPTEYSVGFRYLMHSIYLADRNAIGPAYCIYIVTMTDTWHRFSKRKILTWGVYMPYVIILLLVLTNPFNHNLFYIDSQLNYVRGNTFFIMYICAIFYVAYGFIYLIKSRKLLNTGQLVALLCIAPVMLIALAVQLVMPAYTIEMFCTAIAALMMAMVVQRPDDVYDSATGLYRKSAYERDMRRNFANEKKFNLVTIDIINQTNLRTMLGFKNYNRLIDEYVRKIVQLNSELKTNARMYNVENGRFRCEFSGKNLDMTENFANQINRILKDSMQIDDMDINAMSYVSIVRCPVDIDKFKVLDHYEHEKINIVPYTGKVVGAASIIENRNFNVSNDINNIIENAFANHNFEVYYQPIYSIPENKFQSAEALLRLKDEKIGFVSPEIFIPAAEKSGAIHKIGDFVIEEVCKFIESDDFKKTGIDYIEVNLSVAQCMQNNLAEKILQCMRSHNVKPEQINLEITETATTYSQNILMNNLEKLTEAGISFSLDDYGTGYSNIQRVASLPLKIVKLDKTFVVTENNPKMWIVLQNTVRMLKAMDMEIVVEGVETKQMLERFKELECEYIQGYYFSKPIPKNDFVDFVTKKSIM